MRLHCSIDKLLDEWKPVVCFQCFPDTCEHARTNCHMVMVYGTNHGLESYSNCTDTIKLTYCHRVRVRTLKWRKKRACPARVAEAGQENIETVHEPKPIQAADTL